MGYEFVIVHWSLNTSEFNDQLGTIGMFSFKAKNSIFLLLFGPTQIGSINNDHFLLKIRSLISLELRYADAGRTTAAWLGLALPRGLGEFFVTNDNFFDKFHRFTITDRADARISRVVFA